MRGILGLFLLATGVSLGAYSHYPGTTHRHQSLSELTEIITGSIARDASGAERDVVQTPGSAPSHQPAATRSIANPTANSKHAASTHTSLHGKLWFAGSLAGALAESELETAALGKPAPTTKAIDRARPGVAPPQRLAKPEKALPPDSANSFRKSMIVKSHGWQTAVVKVHETDAKRAKRVTTLKPNSDAERWQLVKKLQTHLKRVGCYWGKVDGIWGRGSKRAIKAFMDSVNASLPHKSPDYLMLSLVEGQRTAACHSPCGNGFERAASGQCVEQQVIASLNNRTRSATNSVTTTQSSTWTTLVTATAMPRQAAVAPPQTADSTRHRPPPLPGRMAIGAPGPKPLAIYAVPVTNPDSNRPSTIRIQKTKRPGKSTVTAALAPNVTADGTPAPVQVVPAAKAQKRAIRAFNKKRRAANKSKVNRRKYKRRYGRSVRSLFTNPLGRM